MSDPDPLSALIGISQDFPKHSASIARNVKVDERIEREVSINQDKTDVKSAFWVNGRIITDKELDAFRLAPLLSSDDIQYRADLARNGIACYRSSGKNDNG